MLGLPASPLGEQLGATWFLYLVGIWTNCTISSLSPSEGEAYKQVKMKMGPVSYVVNVLCFVWTRFRCEVRIFRIP